MNVNLNTTYDIRLSLDSISEYQELLEKKKRQLPQIAENIVSKVSEVGLEDNYKSAEALPIKSDGNSVIGGICTTDEKDTYREFGTGIVGSENPHPDTLSGWIYDVNEHGEKGWVYPKGDGTFGWTKGVPAKEKFYEATKKMEESLPEIAKAEFGK